ncbi:MAG: hypothetical protein ACK5KP_11140 [Paludibacteraceae bacterium]
MDKKNLLSVLAIGAVIGATSGVAFEKPIKEPAKAYKNKKCKSCKLITSCKIHYILAKPQRQACEKYIKRK